MRLNDAQHNNDPNCPIPKSPFIFASFFLYTQPTQAIGYVQNTLPNFVDFSKSVQNGKVNVLRGVYVPNVLALPVIQQPADDAYYVSNRNGEAT